MRQEEKQRKLLFFLGASWRPLRFNSILNQSDLRLSALICG